MTIPAKSPKSPTLFDRRRRPLVRRDAIVRRYDISSRTLDNWIRLKRIPFLKIGKILLFSVEACDQALQRFEIKLK
jgi:hypothetical protein